MKRSRAEWSNFVDVIEGPCAVCGKEVRFVVPDDRPNPAILYHSTCDVMPLVRDLIKTSTPPLMPASHVIVKPKLAAAPVAAATPGTPPVQAKATLPTTPPSIPPATPQ